MKKLISIIATIVTIFLSSNAYSQSQMTFDGYYIPSEVEGEITKVYQTCTLSIVGQLLKVQIGQKEFLYSIRTDLKEDYLKDGTKFFYVHIMSESGVGAVLYATYASEKEMTIFEPSTDFYITFFNF